jgi:AraC-like DNA-binding protein
VTAEWTCENLEPIPNTELRRELRRAWLARDFEVLAGILRELAPASEYRCAQLARDLEMTSRNLQRIFAAALRRCPQEWLNQQRMLAAKQLLVTGHGIKATAYQLGFGHPSQFTRDFRRHFGTTPSAFRDEMLRTVQYGRAQSAEAAQRSPERGAPPATSTPVAAGLAP